MEARISEPLLMAINVSTPAIVWPRYIEKVSCIEPPMRKWAPFWAMKTAANNLVSLIFSSTNKSARRSESTKKEDIEVKLATELPDKWWARIPPSRSSEEPRAALTSFITVG